MSQDHEFAALLADLDPDALNMISGGPNTVNDVAASHPPFGGVPVAMQYYHQASHMEGCMAPTPPISSPVLTDHCITPVTYSHHVPLTVMQTSPSSQVPSMGSPVYSPDQSDQRISPVPPLYSPGQSRPTTSPSACLPKYTSVVSRQTSDGLFAGDLQFQLGIPVQKKLTKSTPFVYSKPLNKLFIQREVQCPITFTISNFQPGLCVRASPFFTHHHHRSAPVTACHVHSQPPTLNGSQSFTSWIKTVSSSSQIVKSNQDMTVMSPWAPAETSMQVTYVFACRNTCVGGPNRRGTTVAFCLENQEGLVIGKAVIEVKVVASPGRDKEKEEKKHLAEQDKQQLPKSPSSSKSSKQSPTFKLPKAPPEEPASSLLGKRVSFVDDRPAKYYIGISDRRTYEMLAPLRDSLDLMNALQDNDTHKAEMKPFKSRYPNTDHSCGRCPSGAESPISNSQQDTSIFTWLGTFGFQCYADAFTKAGLHSMDQITHFTMKNIDELRIIAYHGRIILKNLAKYCEERPLSQPTSSGEALGLIAFSKGKIKLEVVSSSSSED